jgi:hypothetical protein
MITSIITVLLAAIFSLFFVWTARNGRNIDRREGGPR